MSSANQRNGSNLPLEQFFEVVVYPQNGFHYFIGRNFLDSKFSMI